MNTPGLTQRLMHLLMFSSPELRLTNKTKMHLKQQKKNTLKITRVEDVLYLDLQPYPMACTLGSVDMECKQTSKVLIFEKWMLSHEWLMWYRHFINHEKF